MTRIIEIIIELLFDMMTVTMDDLGKTIQHAIRGIFIVLIITNLTDTNIDFTQWSNFSIGNNGSSSNQNTVNQFSTFNNTGDYRIPYDNYTGGGSGLHGLSGWSGVDLTSGCGQPIYSPISGIVTVNGFDGYYGPHAQIDFYGNYVTTISTGYTYPNSSVAGQNTWIEITGDDGIYRTILLHGIYTPEIGQHVSIGEKIGTENSIGNSTGCHSHIVLYENGREINILTPR